MVLMLFYLGCLIPAIQRFPALMGLEIPATYSFLFPMVVGVLAFVAIRRGTVY